MSTFLSDISITAVFPAAILSAAIFLTGCGKSEGSEPVTSYPSETAEVSETQTAEEITVNAVHDLDPEAMDRAGEGVPFFFAARAEDKTFVPSDETVKFSGRHIERNDICYLSYTCSAVSFIMSGDRAEAVLSSNGGAYSSKQQGWVGVVINGELTRRIRLADGEETYLLYEGEMLDGAEISIVKLTENQMANTGVKSITCHARMLAPAHKKELSIEIIGDSIACGYGNEADGPENGLNGDEENGMEAFAYLTAKKLDADYSLVCISGLGLISNYTDYTGVRENYLLMDSVYDYTDTNFELRRGYDEYTKWDFGGGSDIVVINIGTNDYSYTGRDEDRQQEFYDAYYAFLGDVRKNNPHAEIVCTMGIMGAELFGQIEAAAQAFDRDNGDGHIHTMKFDYQNEKNGFGADYHPTAASHEESAQQLADFLRENVIK